MMLSALVAVCAPAVTRTVKLDVPAAVGVPAITPVPAFSVSPAGSVPLASDHVYGGIPPLAVSVVEYATPCVPPGRAVVVIDTAGGAATTMLSALVALCAPAVTRAVMLNVPDAVGVPEITPVPAVRVMPAGSAPLAIDQLYGGVPPVAARVAL